MHRIQNSLIAIGGLSLLIGAIAFVTPRPTQGQAGDTVGPTKPVKVVNTDKPFQARLIRTFDEFTVPTDKRLVIEYVSGSASNDTACQLISVIVETTVQGKNLDHAFIPTLIATTTTGVPLYVVSQETSLYADPGTSVRLLNSHTGESPCDPFVSVTISGHLVDVP